MKHSHNLSSITCPECGHTETETMPQDACVHLYECKNCQTLLKPEAGDCCIFCSKGSHPCPTSQRESQAYSCMTKNPLFPVAPFSPIQAS